MAKTGEEKKPPVYCFSCGKPNASFSDRQLSFVLMRNAHFCKDDFKLAILDLQNALKDRPKSKAILDRIFTKKL